MASSTEEEENFFLLYKLTVGIGTKAVKDKFDQLYPPNNLSTTLQTHQPKLKRELRKYEYDEVFPQGMPPSPSSEFDIPLMVSLMRFIVPPNKYPINVTNTLPSNTDTSLEAALSRIKWYRNSFSHNSKQKINASEYDTLWQLMSQTITTIGGQKYKSQCDNLKDSHIPLDERERLRRELNARRSHDKTLSSMLNIDKQARLEADTAALIEEEIRESTFVETKASQCALEFLKSNGVVLLTGGAGTGKSRMGLMVLHNFQHSNPSYRGIKLNTIDEWNVLDRPYENQKFIVLLDNIFGETNCTFNKERNEPTLDKIYAYVRKGDIKVVITIRDTVKQYCAEIFETHRLFRFDFIDLNAPLYYLLPREKEEMLVRHFSQTRECVQVQKESNLIDKNGIILTRHQLMEIIHSNPVHGFPLTVYRFVNNPKFLELGSEFFTSSTIYVLDDISKIRRKGKDNENLCLHYAVLIYIALNGDSFNINDNCIVDEINSITDTVYGKKIRCNKRDVSDAIQDMLKQGYLIKDPNHPCYHFSHITLQESVILSFAADAEDSTINKIITILSLSFIVKVARSADYKEKEKEVVLKVPEKCYPLLAERVVKLFLENENTELALDVRYFMNSEIFDNVGDKLLSPMIDSYFRNAISENGLEPNPFGDDVCLPAVLLRCAAKMKEKTSHVFLYLLSRVANKIIQPFHYQIADNCKSAIVDCIYKICSTQDVKVVTDALHIAKQCDINVSDDQFLDLKEMHKSTVYIYQCIIESYSTNNLAVMRHFNEKLKDKTFDVNLFLRRMYLDPRKHMSLRSIKFLHTIATFDENAIELMIKQSCERHLLPEVKYLFALKDRADTNAVYIECFLKCNCKYCYEMANDADKCGALFKFLLTPFYHNGDGINRILKLMQEQPLHSGRFLNDLFAVVDRRLLCFTTVLSLACETSDVQSVKWVFNNIGLEHVDIEKAFVISVSAPRHRYISNVYNNAQSRLEIVKYLLTFINKTEFNFEDALDAVRTHIDFRKNPFCIYEKKIDTRSIVTNAILNDEFKFVEWIIENGCKLHFNLNMVMIAFCSIQMVFHDNNKTFIEKLWRQVDEKGVFDQKKIVDEACKNGVDSQICIWFLEVFDHKLIDIKKLLTMSYRRCYLDVVTYIVEKVDHDLFQIDINLFLKKNLSCVGNRNEKLAIFLLSKSMFTVVKFQTLMKKAIHCERWEIVKSLLIHCKNDIHIFDMKTIVQACCSSGNVNFLSWMMSNEGTENCIEFVDIDSVITEKCCGIYFDSKSLPKVFSHILYKLNVQNDMNNILKKICSYKRLNVEFLDWIIENVDHDCIDLNLILQSCCRHAEYSFVKLMVSKLDKDQIDFLSAFLEACRSLVENNWSFKTDIYNTICLIDFLFQKCGADMFNISEGVDLAIRQGNYKLIYYFFAKGLCRDIVIDMKMLLNNACCNGEYDLTVWILKNIPNNDLDLSSALINACNYASTNDFESNFSCFFSYLDFNDLQDDFGFSIFRGFRQNIQNTPKYASGLWCAMFILEKLDFTHSLKSEAVLSIAREKNNTRMGQWLEYFIKTGSKYLTQREPDPKLQQGTLTSIPNQQSINILMTTTDMNSPASCSTSDDKTASSDHSQKNIVCSVPSTEIIKDDNEHFEPSGRNSLCDASGKTKRPIENDTTTTIF